MLLVAGWLGRSIASGQWLNRELSEIFWPNLAHVAEAFRHGEWPAWNPYDRGGVPFAADPQVALYYPLTWLFALVGVRGVLPAVTLQIYALLHLAIAGVGLHAYLRTRRLPQAAAATGGVLLMTSIPWLVQGSSGVCWPLAWAPLVWIAIDRLLERAHEPGLWRRGAALGGALGLAAAAGAPVGFFYLLLASLMYGAFRWLTVLVVTGEDAGRRAVVRTLGRQLAALVVAAAVTSALTLVVVLPALAVVDESVSWRSVRYMLGVGGTPETLQHALPVGPALAGLLSPSVGLVNLYAGVLVLVLALVALGARWRADGGAPLLFAALALIGAAFSFGAATPVLPWLVLHISGFGLFHEPDRYATLLALALAVLGAYGVSALVDEESWLRRRALVAGVVALVALVAALVALHVAAPMSYVALVGGAVLLAAAALLPARFRAALVTAAVGLVVLDVSSFSAPLAVLRDTPVDDQEDARWLAGLGDVQRTWRVYDEFVMEQRPGSRLGVRDLRGPAPGDPLDSIRFAQVRERLTMHPELLGAFNVRWVLFGLHHAYQHARHRLAREPDGLRPELFRKLDEHRYEVVGAAPLVLWYSGVVLSDHQHALDYLAMQEAQPGKRMLAVVERTDVPAGTDAAARLEHLGSGEVVQAPQPPVAGALVAYAAERVEISVDAPAEGLVVLNEAYAPGWKVAVDGKPATSVRANYLLRGVVVSAGAHRVVWTYAPRDDLAWLALWGAGVAFVLAAGVGGWGAGRRSRMQQQEDERAERAEDDEEREQEG
jgi:hypothetical protein